MIRFLSSQVVLISHKTEKMPIHHRFSLSLFDQGFLWKGVFCGSSKHSTPVFCGGVYTFWETVSKPVCVFQHTGEWRRPWCLRAPSLREGLLLCSGGPSAGDSSDAAQRHSRQRELCLLVPPRAQDSHGWDWAYSPEDSLSENQWWSCQRICEVEIWVPLHRGGHLSRAV